MPLRPYLLSVTLGWLSFFCLIAQAQSLALADLPYRDPRPLDALLSNDDTAFELAIGRTGPG